MNAKIYNLNPEIIAEYRKRLLAWYKDNRRDFPWRKKKGVYELLVAEILLQKTNAEKVERVYPKFLYKYPTSKKLRSAKINEIKKIIKPLGLHYKAETLKKAAAYLEEEKEIVDENDLKKIKGVGKYIANSIMIHSANKKLGLLDSNFIRIYERIFKLTSDNKRPRTDKKLWDKSKVLMPENNISEYCFAVLDFAAQICTAQKPNCHSCPMYSDLCSGISED